MADEEREVFPFSRKGDNGGLPRGRKDKKYGGEEFQPRRERKLTEQGFPPSSDRSVLDPCWSKSESHRYFTKFRDKPSQAFNDRVTEYGKMHQYCMESRQIVASFYQNETNDENKINCQYLIHKGAGGFGNQMQGLLSAFLFSLLTNRALIVEKKGDSSLLCSPFPNSSWVLGRGEDRPILQSMAGQRTSCQNLRQMVERKETLSNKVSLYLKFDANRDDESFFCDASQTVLRSVAWIQLHQARYLAPSFVTMEGFRSEIERLFPNRLIFTHLARYLLHPQNFLWERITRSFHSHLSYGKERIGIQIRTFADVDLWANERILDCLCNISRSIPPPLPPEKWMALIQKQLKKSTPVKEVQDIVENRNPSTKVVFVTSIHREHMEFLKSLYEEGIASDGSIVIVHSQGHVGMEDWSLGQHSLALIDIWLLSFCDHLLISSQSTFGILASGLAGIRPYVMNIAQREYGSRKKDPKAVWRTNGLPVCSLSPSVDPCAQPPIFRSCGNNVKGLDGGKIPKNLEYLKFCSADYTPDWQIISS